jgi:hypothetical protein
MSTQPTIQTITCDGCSQASTSEHIARRLERLEQTTRYRPIHIQAVFLGAQSPAGPDEFLYGARGSFLGEAAAVLKAAQIEHHERAAEIVLTEFQRKGLLLTHVLECAPDTNGGEETLTGALKKRLPSLLRRLRGSLRPKRVIVISQEMAPVVAELKAAQLGCELLLDSGSPFDLADAESASRLQSALRGV